MPLPHLFPQEQNTQSRPTARTLSSSYSENWAEWRTVNLSSKTFKDLFNLQFLHWEIMQIFFASHPQQSSLSPGPLGTAGFASYNSKTVLCFLKSKCKYEMDS